MHPMVAIGMICAMALCASAEARTRSADRTTWAKKDVAFDRYVADARECGIHGGMMDARAHESGKLALRALQTEDIMLNSQMVGAPGIALDQRYLKQTLDPNRRIDALQTDQVTTVESCLADRGYARKTLTRGEVRQLRRLPLGSRERRAYLHEIAAR